MSMRLPFGLHLDHLDPYQAGAAAGQTTSLLILKVKH